MPDDGVDNPARVSAGLRRMVVPLFPSGAPIARGRFRNGATFRGDCAGGGKWFRSRGELFRGAADCFAAGDAAKQSACLRRRYATFD
jgi:hypothetical protein